MDLIVFTPEVKAGNLRPDRLEEPHSVDAIPNLFHLIHDVFQRGSEGGLQGLKMEVPGAQLK